MKQLLQKDETLLRLLGHISQSPADILNALHLLML